MVLKRMMKAKSSICSRHAILFKMQCCDFSSNSIFIDKIWKMMQWISTMLWLVFTNVWSLTLSTASNGQAWKRSFDFFWWTLFLKGFHFALHDPLPPYFLSSSKCWMIEGREREPCCCCCSAGAYSCCWYCSHHPGLEPSSRRRRPAISPCVLMFLSGIICQISLWDEGCASKWNRSLCGKNCDSVLQAKAVRNINKRIFWDYPFATQWNGYTPPMEWNLEAIGREVKKRTITYSMDQLLFMLSLYYYVNRRDVDFVPVEMNSWNGPFFPHL